MSKRSDSFSSFVAAAVPAGREEDAGAPSSQPRLTSGSVRSMRESFSGVERENERLSLMLRSGDKIVELDPERVHGGGVADRFSIEGPAYEALKESIRQHGQQVPILVRPHPGIEGDYQSAYGRRRVRALRELDRPVRAVVRHLSDADMAIAQGLENSVRLDLTFIERAVFARRLGETFNRTVVQSALGVDKTEVSKLISVAERIPAKIIEAIGAAPKAGRPRWLAFAKAIEPFPNPIVRLLTVMNAEEFKALPSDDRFVRLLARASEITAAAEGRPDGAQAFGVVRGSGKGMTVRFRTEVEPGFAPFLAERLPELYELFKRAQPREGEEANPEQRS